MFFLNLFSAWYRMSNNKSYTNNDAMNTLNTTFFNKDIILWIYNETHLQRRLPAMILSGFLMLVGIIGNTLVVYAYGMKFKKSSANFFICSLGVIDLTCCVLSIPFEIFTLRFHYVNFNTVACKFFRGVGMAVYIAEGFMLVFIAFDRYYKVCRPLKVSYMSKSSTHLSIIVCLGLIFGWPALFVFGEHSAETTFPDIYGKSCMVDDNLKTTIYPTLFFCNLLLIFIVCFSLIVILYGRIFHSILKWKKERDILKMKYARPEIGLNRNSSSSSLSSYTLSALYSRKVEYHINLQLNNDNNRQCENTTRSNLRFSFLEKFNTSINRTQTVNMKIVSSNRKNTRMVKTTLICVTVTVTFILSYVPYLTLQILLKSNQLKEESESLLLHQMIEVAAKSYCINNASNAIIYSIFNPKFRQCCKEMFYPVKK